MVSQGKVTQATLEEIVAKVKAGVPEIEGALVGDKWEGYTPHQLRVDVYRRKALPGFFLGWAYHDTVGEHHQCGQASVQARQVDALVARIAQAATEAVPGRYIQEVEVARAQAADPILAVAARIKAGDEDEDYDEDYAEEVAAETAAMTAEMIRDTTRHLSEAAAREQEEGQTVVHSDPALAQAAQLQDESEVETDQETDPETETETEDAADGELDPNVEAEGDQG